MNLDYHFYIATLDASRRGSRFGSFSKRRPMKSILHLLLLLAALCTACGRSKLSSPAFEDSVLAAVSANRISFELPRISQQEGAVAAEKKEKEMIVLMEKSIAEGKKVPDTLLEELHPELKKFYRENLMRGQALFIEGLRTSDVSKQVAAVQAMMAWAEFWDQNKKAILDKLG